MLNIHLIKRIEQHCYSLKTRKLSTICIKQQQQQQQRQQMMFKILSGVFTNRVQLSGGSTKYGIPSNCLNSYIIHSLSMRTEV